MTTVPYSIERRPDTGVNNPTLGVWLFLASEAMLFGGLFSAYFMLRAGAEAWPAGPSVLSLPLGSINTIVLLLSSAAFTLAVQAARAERPARVRWGLGLSMLLSIVFLAIKYVEWSGEIGRGLLPRTDVFLALYYLLTAVHAVHVAGGLIVSAGLLRWGADRRNPRHLTVRLASTALYWYFVDVMWLIIFGLMYVA